MNTKKVTKLIHEGNFVAEVDVSLMYTEEGWSPYLSLEDAYKLDEVRSALKNNDLKTAARLSRIYSLNRIA
mgnify:CR=1 FL=1|uniref:Uncharacterized protein n=1 Tax=Gracilinema caldarium TaxID=215591 RepID=A0A7C3EER3_9SPIR